MARVFFRLARQRGVRTMLNFLPCLTMKIDFAPKIDWWIYFVCGITVLACIIGPAIDGDTLIGVFLALLMLVLWICAIYGVKYQIRENKLGIRKFFHWTWIPISKIAIIQKEHGVAVQGSVSAVLSLDRLRITLTDKSVLKSSMPVDIFPKDTDRFIAKLQEINPDIVEK